MTRFTRARISGLVLSGMLAAGIAFVAPTSASAAATGETTAVALHQAGPGHSPLKGRALIRALIRSAANLTGTEVSAVRQAVSGGQSIAQYASANGSSGEAVVQAVVAKAKERLDKAVANGRISQQLADAMLQELSTNATTLVNDTALAGKLRERP